MIRKISMLMAVCMICSILAGIGPPVRAEENEVNLVPNSGFEETAADSNWLNGIGAPGWGIWYATKGGIVSVSQAVYHSGQAALQIEQPQQARTNVSVSGIVPGISGVPVEGGKNYKLSVWMKTDDVAGTGVVFRSYYHNGNTKVSNGPASTVKGTTDWVQQELFVAVPSDADMLRIEIMFETGTGVVWVDDVSLVRFDGLTGLALDASYLELQPGQQFRLNPVLTPANATETSLVWSSSDPSVAEVADGSLTAKAHGYTVIRVETPDGKLYAECGVSVVNPGELAEIDGLRLKWYDRLTGNSLYQADDPDMAATVADAVSKMTNEDGTGRWDTMNKAENRTYLWEDNSSTTASSHIANSYNIIKSMALAYSYKDSPVYQNPQLRDDIIGALDWMYDNRYNERIPKIYDNWYHWEIAVPKALGDIMVLMYDELSAEQLANYIRAIDWFVPDPVKRKSLRDDFRETGANLLDKALAVTVRGIAGKSPFKIVQGSTAIGPEYIYAVSGDGVYEDGSLVQHFDIAYTGGYGSVWLNNTAELMYLLKDSTWTITDPQVNHVYQWVFNTFEPVIYKGAMMDMVNGRGISREGEGSGGTKLCILRLAQSAPENLAAAMKRMVKEWVLKDTAVDNYYAGMGLYDMVLLKAVMDDPSIAPRGELVKSQVFAGMDRVVHLRESFAFGISMFSDRISAFEFGNGENLKGWYTGMGMTYLYNHDLLQYKDDFWPTVDSYRLAGTTTDGSFQTPVAWASYRNPNKWVGGVSLDNLYSAAGMEFSLSGSTGSSLSGKKSWFNFDDEIVALGSDIGGGDGRAVETIVENRKIANDNGNALTVNGEAKDSALGWTETMEQVRWAHLEGNVPGTDVGYVFPAAEAPDIKGLREARTGAWSEINTTQSDTPRTRNYVSLAFDHGADPQQASYAYVLLPGKSQAETEGYSRNPDIEILSQTNEVHAVKETRLGITAANFWEPGTVAGITSQNPAAVLVQEKGGSVTVSVSDPTQSQALVQVELEKSGLELVSADEGVEATVSSEGVQLAFSTKGAIGRSFTAVFKLPSQGGSSGSTGNGVVVPPEDVKDGHVTVKPQIQNGLALAKLEASLLEKVFQSAAADATGIYEAVIRIEELSVGAGYALELPSEFLASDGQNRRIRLETPAGVLLAPGHMLAGTAIPESHVRLSISPADAKEWGEQVWALNGGRPAVELALSAGGQTIPWDNAAAPVKVMLDYDPAAGELQALEHLGIYSVSPAGETGPVPSGRYHEAERQVAFAASSLGRFAVVLVQKSFPDLDNHPWARKGIEVLAAKGIIEGVSEGRFAPESDITRADFTLLLTRMLNLAAGEADAFDDISPADYYYGALKAARAAGLALGGDNNRFRPGEPISRQDMMVLAYRALQLAGVQAGAGEAGSLAGFADHRQLAGYAAPAAEFLTAAGLIEGDDGNRLKPLEHLTRAEAAAVLYRLYQQL